MRTFISAHTPEVIVLTQLTSVDPEPALGSVLIRQGITGTCLQRFRSDGLYHSANGKVMTYAEMFYNRGRPDQVSVYLIYEPDERD